MPALIRVLVATAVLLAPAAQAEETADGSAHWGYEGAAGPAHWGELSDAYATCKQGTQQSPVDIHATSTRHLAELELSYAASPARIINNGHTVQAEYAEGSSVSLDGKTYALRQFHFHAPSEHTIDGKPYDMVAHLVHESADGELLVIAVLMKVGAPNPFLAGLWPHLPAPGEEYLESLQALNVILLLPTDLSSYRYRGSLTTPPCTEGVTWIVLEHPVELSAEQLERFKTLYTDNVRPVQPLHGRRIVATE
jgi:carbonic anhydrase